MVRLRMVTPLWCHQTKIQSQNQPCYSTCIELSLLNSYKLFICQYPPQVINCNAASSSTSLAADVCLLEHPGAYCDLVASHHACTEKQLAMFSRWCDRSHKSVHKSCPQIVTLILPRSESKELYVLSRNWQRSERSIIRNVVVRWRSYPILSYHILSLPNQHPTFRF